MGNCTTQLVVKNTEWIVVHLYQSKREYSVQGMRTDMHMSLGESCTQLLDSVVGGR